MTSPVVGHQTTTESRSNRPTVTNRRPRWAIRCGGCDNWWTGLNSAHCSGCHQTFTGVGGFDMHRRRGKCLDPADIGLVPADKPWPGWSRPGTWSGPGDG